MSVKEISQCIIDKGLLKAMTSDQHLLFKFRGKIKYVDVTHEHTIHACTKCTTK